MLMSPEGRRIPALPATGPYETSPGRLTARLLTSTEPAILRGLGRHWPACATWSWELLAGEFAEIVAPVEAVPAGCGSAAEFLAARQEVRLPVGALMAVLGSPPSPIRRAGPTLYLISTDTPTWSPTLMADLPDLGDLLPASARRPWSPTFVWRRCERVFFFGPAGTVTHAHSDPQPGLLVQLLGQKTVHLAPPHAARRLRGITEPLPATANRWLGADLAALAVREDATELGICSGWLGPGDALLIPAGWWHDVRSTSAAVSVNYGWRSWCDLRGVRALRQVLHAWRRR